MRGEKGSREILSAVLSEARKVAPEAEVLATLESGRRANTRFARGEVTSTGDVEDTEVTVELALGKRLASSSTNQLDPASLRALVERTARMAKLAPEDPEWLGVLAPQRHAKVPSAFDAATAQLSADARADAVSAAIRAGDERSLEMAGFYSLTAGATTLASSAGLRAHFPSTRAELTLTARLPDGHGSGWAGAVSERAADLDAEALARTAVQKAVASSHPALLEPGRYTVVLEPAAVAELLFFLTIGLDARLADEGRSFFARPGGSKVGQKLFADGITLRSNPADPALPSAPFDGDGLPLAPMTWIENGTLKALAYSRFWAKKQGKAPTGQPSSFVLDGGKATREELISGVERGVLITRFWYTRSVDPQTMLITGLTRDGVLLIEKGKLAGPVNNFRFNESPITMLANADALSRETVRVPGALAPMRVPALRTHGFNLASVSEAI